MQEGLEDMEVPELLLLVLETSLVSLCMKIMSVLITVILYGRMIEIYLYCSVSPIPFATMTNREPSAYRLGEQITLCPTIPLHYIPLRFVSI